MKWVKTKEREIVMAVKIEPNFPQCSASNSNGVVLHPLSRRVSLYKACFKIKYVQSCMANLRQKDSSRFGQSKFEKLSPFCNVKLKSFQSIIVSAASEDGIAVNRSSNANSEGDLEKMRLKLNQSIRGEDASNDLVQCLHDAARVFELAIENQGSLTQGPLFSKSWLGIDQNAWVKTLSYQASVHALLQAASEIASRGDSRDREVNVFVQRSLLHQSSPLEKSIRDQLFSKDPVACEWFWSEQHPAVVTNFINILENDPRFTAVTSLGWEGAPLSSSRASDLSLLMLALSSIAALMKLGPAKVSCSQFSSTLFEMNGKLMDTLANLIPIDQVYHFTTEVGLRREFLGYFGPRATAYRGKNNIGGEGAFWVDLVQQQLRGAISRERIWSRLTTYESIEVLERDLAIFGFFIALGRRTQSYLDASNIDILDESLASFLRYLVGGSVLFYPQLSSVSTYQIFVEVVCEEMDWLPFYPEGSTMGRQVLENRRGHQSVSNMEAVALALDVCSHWVQLFIKYSVWLEKPSHIKAARFLSTSHSKLEECRNALYTSATDTVPKYETGKGIDVGRENKWNSGEQTSSKACIQIEEINLFDKELQCVDEALNRLEGLLKEIHVCSSNSGKEHLEAACTDLERIRKLKKEAEFLEASWRAKAASLQQGIEDNYFQPLKAESGSQSKRRSGKLGQGNQNEKESKGPQGRSVENIPRGLRNFLLSHSNTKKGGDEDRAVTIGSIEDGALEQTIPIVEDAATVSNEIRRFEQLQHELVELERRFQENADGFLDQKGYYNNSDQAASSLLAIGGGYKLSKVEKEENILRKSIGKLKEAGSDVWEGTRLLATDVAAAMGFLQRALTGDELTDKEKKILRRTLTDLASVIPIGILMLLPVTAVGHAAMLAAIKRYFPAMIPSAYARERLDLLRQLEKLQEMDVSASSPDEENVEVPKVQINAASDAVGDEP